MSTPNRPGSRPVPPSEPAEQQRTSARPQPAVRPGTQPPQNGGNRPPVRPPNGPSPVPGRPAQQTPQQGAPQRPGTADGPAAGRVPPAERSGAPAPQQASAPPRPAGPGAKPAADPKSADRPVAPPASRPAASQARDQPRSGQPANGQPQPPMPPRSSAPARPSAAQQPPTEAAPRVETERPAPPRPDAPRADERPFDPLHAGDVAQPATAAFENPQAGPVRSAPVQGNGTPQGAPPWQRGTSQGAPQQGAPQGSPRSPQNQPQTNLSARGGTLPQGDPAQGAPAGYNGPENPVDKTQRREAAKSKAAGIDGPTRHIERKDLAKDMPDLSEVRHSEPGPDAQKVAQPVAIAAREDGQPLRATIQLRKIDPWSTLKISLVIAVSLFFVWMVAVGLLYAVLDGMGVWDRLNSAFTEIVNESGDGGLVSAGQVFGYAAVIGIINMVLFTALTTIGSFIYNLSSDLVGGVEVTLADRD